MSYVIKLQKEFKALQGLKSPIRDAKKLPSLQPQEGYELVLKIGVGFADAQMNDRGWFVDTDSLDDYLEDVCLHLESKKWTELFDFRPTFEMVTQWAYHELAANIPQLTFVEIDNKTLGISTSYFKEK